MASNYWAKLWIEMLDDRKTAALPDSSWRRFVECILLAKELNDGGILPAVVDMAWRLRIDPATLADDLTRLALSGLVELRDCQDGERWFVTNFEKRQEKMSGQERVSRFRTAQNKGNYYNVTGMLRDGNGTVTDRYTETETETETEGEKNARATATITATTINPPLPPPKAIAIIPDRTPGAASSYLTSPDIPESKQQPDPQAIAAGHVANAISEITGISAKLNHNDVFECAIDLVRAGYTPEQLRTHYGREQYAGKWNWYADDWRGKKGDRPKLRDIRETIYGAVSPPAPVKKTKQNMAERFMAGLGLSQEEST